MSFSVRIQVIFPLSEVPDGAYIIIFMLSGVPDGPLQVIYRCRKVPMVLNKVCFVLSEVSNETLVLTGWCKCD
jgi:hypothetical protein